MIAPKMLVALRNHGNQMQSIVTKKSCSKENNVVSGTEGNSAVANKILTLHNKTNET